MIAPNLGPSVTVPVVPAGTLQDVENVQGALTEETLEKCALAATTASLILSARAAVGNATRQTSNWVHGANALTESARQTSANLVLNTKPPNITFFFTTQRYVHHPSGKRQLKTSVTDQHGEVNA